MSSRQKHSDAELSRWLKLCDPSEPALPGSDLHYPLDDQRLRGSYDRASISRPLVLGGEQSCQLFTGFSGTGKSTELLQVKLDLERRGYLVLMANALDYLALSRKLEFEDLLVVVAGAFGDETDALVPPVNRTLGNYWEKLVRLFKTEVELGEIGSSIGVFDLKFNIKHGREIWTEARKRLAMTPGRLEREAHGHVSECIARLNNRFPDARGIVFIFDSLEKLRGSIDQFREIMDSAVRTFTDYSSELKLPGCHVIYTVPPYLPLLAPALSSHYSYISEILPAVKIEEIRSRSPLELARHQPGIEALRGLVGKRVPLDVFFGTKLGYLDSLIAASGGHVRTLVAMIRDLVYRIHEFGSPIDADDVASIISRYRERASLGLWEEHTLLLHKIQHEASVVGIAQDQLPIVADFMDRQMVLCYRNGEGWYQVHPLVRDYVEARAAAYLAEPPRTGF